MVTIGTVRFAGTDPYGGAAHVIGHERNEHLDRFRFGIEGPLEGTFGVSGAALVVEHYLRRGAAGGTGRGSGHYVVNAYRKEAPEVVAAAGRMMDLEVSALAASGVPLAEVPSEVWAALAG
jgi:hypothetical protein